MLGRPFDLYTDNSAVTYFLSQRSLTPRQARWIQKFAEYTFNLYHLPGPRNVAADALSRRPDHLPEFKLTSEQLHQACANSLQSSLIQLSISHVVSSSSLCPLRQSGPSGDNHFFELLTEDAELDTEYSDVLKSTAEGNVPDFTEKDGLIWYTPGPDVQPRLYVPQGKARELLINSCTGCTTGLTCSAPCRNMSASVQPALAPNRAISCQWEFCNHFPCQTIAGNRSAMT